MSLPKVVHPRLRATGTKGATVSTTEGLYGAVQRGIIKEMLRLAQTMRRSLTMVSMWVSRLSMVSL